MLLPLTFGHPTPGHATAVWGRAGVHGKTPQGGGHGEAFTSSPVFFLQKMAFLGHSAHALHCAPLPGAERS